MKVLFAKDLVPGMSIGWKVTDEKGMIKLLEKGTCLTPAQIVRVHKWGVPFLIVDDKDKEDDQKNKTELINIRKSRFLNIYRETIIDIAKAFRYMSKFKEVPIIKMKELAEQKITLLVETIGALDFLYELRCYSEYTFHHSLNVAIITGILGKWCNYKKENLKDLILAGLLHDIGKAAVPLTILDKPGRLSPREFAVIKRHSWEGFQLIRYSTQISYNVKLSILQHHERLDGSGYPFGLTDNEIDNGAKIIAIADIYDAITSDRTYHRRATPFEALDIIAEEMFNSLDTHLCLTFLDNMRDYLLGSNVVLSNGQVAKIIAFTTKNKYFTKPVVYIPNGHSNGHSIDLQKAKISIVGITEEKSTMTL